MKGVGGGPEVDPSTKSTGYDPWWERILAQVWLFQDVLDELQQLQFCLLLKHRHIQILFQCFSGRCGKGPLIVAIFYEWSKFVPCLNKFCVAHNCVPSNIGCLFKGSPQLWFGSGSRKKFYVKTLVAQNSIWQ